MNRKQFISLVLAGVIAGSTVPMSSMAAEQPLEGATVTSTQLQEDADAESTQEAPTEEADTSTSEEEASKTADTAETSEAETKTAEEETASEAESVNAQASRNQEALVSEKNEETFTVTWQINDKTYTTKVKKGEMPVYDGPEIQRIVEETKISTFSRWTPSLHTAKGNTTYKAVFDQKSRWVFQNKKTLYLQEDGVTYTKGFLTLRDQTLYFDENGYKVTSQWSKINGKWYYFDAYGYAMTGWGRNSGSKINSYNIGEYPMIYSGAQFYYFNSKGEMKTGWVKEGKYWYYFGSNGALKTGWVKDGNSWYYMDRSYGMMKTGWVKDGKTWYYMDGSGRMISNRWMKIGGYWYYFTGSGAMKTGWLQDRGYWYFMDLNNGNMRTGWFSDGYKRYHANGSGVMERSKWISDGGVWYYIGSGGNAATGRQKIGGTWYWFNGDGSIAQFKNVDNMSLISDYRKLSGIIPARMVNYFYSQGNRIVMTSGKIPGYPDAAGLCNVGGKKIYLRKNVADNYSALHEFGHYVACVTNGYGSGEAKAIYKAEKSKYYGIYDSYMDSYARTDCDEFVAEAFACYFYSTCTRNNLKNKCPKTYAYIDRLIAVYPGQF